ncbi:MAG: UPF0262 family protein [Rhodobacterales bacterium]|jgi:uncharacterized protein (UPF0262 family)|tara:strand:- start:1939 stop:2421 length:483 start_codon:yes stop_codon:yes gene_type:complete
MSYLIEIKLETKDSNKATPEIIQEREVALFDLLEKNTFVIPKETDFVGPYRLNLKIFERRLVFEVFSSGRDRIVEFQLSLVPFQQVVKDYFKICKSYLEAVKRLSPSKIETIDMARRGIHGEGARVLQERLRGKVELDDDTARRLFTLICVLHYGDWFEV